MVYSSSDSPQPEDHESFYGKEFLGTVRKEDYPEKMEEVLRALEMPPRQKAFNVRRMRTEQVRGDGTFYGEGEVRERMWKCTEWTVERAIPALFAAGILKK